MPHDDSSLEGSWEMVRAEFAGEKAPELVLRKTTVEFAGKKYFVRFDGKVVDEGHFALAVTGDHAAATFSGIIGTNAGRVIPAIYQLHGERLRICWGFGGVAPTGFITAPGSQLYLATYRRPIPHQLPPDGADPSE
jgi:uncharacterized protein (TIGR03067 family)